MGWYDFTIMDTHEEQASDQPNLSGPPRIWYWKKIHEGGQIDQSCGVVLARRKYEHL